MNFVQFQEVQNHKNDEVSSFIKPSVSDIHAWLKLFLENEIDFQLASERRCLPPNLFIEFSNKGLFGNYFKGNNSDHPIHKIFDVYNCVQNTIYLRLQY